eukprot:scaffold82663_cov49-Phaeocystis_antarctica.AAC.1
MPVRVSGVAEADSLCAELAESVPPTMPIPVELSVVAITGVPMVELERRAAPSARIRADRGENIQVDDGEHALEQQRQIRPVIAALGAVRRLPPHLWRP